MIVRNIGKPDSGRCEMSANCNERDGVGTGMRGEGAQVVTNVSVAYMVENSIQYSVVTVHRRKRTAKVVPFFATVVRQLDVRVLQLSDEHQPEIDDEIRYTINTHHAPKPKMVAKVIQKTDHDKQAGVRKEDKKMLGLPVVY